MKQKYITYTNNLYKYTIGGISVLSLILLYFCKKGETQTESFDDTMQTMTSLVLILMLIGIPYAVWSYTDKVSKVKKNGDENTILHTTLKWFSIRIAIVAFITLLCILCYAFIPSTSIFMAVIPAMILVFLCKPEKISTLITKNN